jgi:membrane protein implicated in regulation of membrane protease activity
MTGHPAAALAELAQVHSYTTAFWWAAGMFATGSVLAALLFRPARPQRRAQRKPRQNEPAGH